MPKNFAPNAPIYFGKAFEVPRNFSRKVSLVRGLGQKAPTSDDIKIIFIKYINFIIWVLKAY